MKKLALALVAASLIASPALAQEKKQSPVGYDNIKKCLEDLGLKEGDHFRPVSVQIKDTEFGADISRAIWRVESFAPKRAGVKFCIGATEKVEQTKQ